MGLLMNRSYQVCMQRINRDYLTYIRYFSDFKTAYSCLRYHVLHSYYSGGFVKRVGQGAATPIVAMRIKGPLCYRWFGKIRLGHADDIIYHHKPPQLCNKKEGGLYG